MLCIGLINFLGQYGKLQPVWSGPWIAIEVISSLYRISNRKRSLVNHQDSLKMCNDRDLHIWLRRKRHGLLGTKEDGASDSELEQTSDVWGEPDDHTNNYMGIEELFAEDEMSHGQAIGQSNDARELE